MLALVLALCVRFFISCVVVDVVYDMVCVAVVPSYDVAGVRVIDAGIVTVVGCVVACVVGVVVGSCVFDVRCVYYCRMV